VLLFLPLFGEEFFKQLALGFIGCLFKQTEIARDVLASNESVHYRNRHLGPRARSQCATCDAVTISTAATTDGASKNQIIDEIDEKKQKAPR
jgi:hypothetical protein